MERFYKMWTKQLYHHLERLRPSGSVTSLSPQGHSQTALKKQKAGSAAWSPEALLPWLTMVFMVVWLMYQSYRHAMGVSSVEGSPFKLWSRNSSALPNVVPMTYQTL